MGPFDCNGNGVSDPDEIASGATSDCDADGVPDECQIADAPSLDCDANGVLDSCELLAGTALDCNGNGIPDSCDVAAGTSLDCNGNGVPDECDISSGSSDCNEDGIPDACQIAGNPSLDQNANGILDSCECAIESFCLAAANSTGQPAAMGGSGTASLSANNLTLSVSNAPPFQFGLFFYGANETFTIFGDGALCVSGPLARVLPVIATDGTGSADFPLDLNANPFTVAPNIIAPFETWRFQFWYRDPLGGPSGFNLTDGLAVTFCP